MTYLCGECGARGGTEAMTAVTFGFGFIAGLVVATAILGVVIIRSIVRDYRAGWL